MNQVFRNIARPVVLAREEMYVRRVVEDVLRNLSQFQLLIGPSFWTFARDPKVVPFGVWLGNLVLGVLPCPTGFVQVVEETANAYPAAHLSIDPQFPTANPFLVLDDFSGGHVGSGMVDDAADDDVG